MYAFVHSALYIAVTAILCAIYAVMTLVCLYYLYSTFATKGRVFDVQKQILCCMIFFLVGKATFFFFFFLLLLSSYFPFSLFPFFPFSFFFLFFLFLPHLRSFLIVRIIYLQVFGSGEFYLGHAYSFVESDFESMTLWIPFFVGTLAYSLTGFNWFPSFSF